MKNKLFTIIIFFFLNSAYAENIEIIANNISINKKENSTIFENDVVVKTKNKTIKSQFVKYDRENKFLVIRKNINVVDEKNNTMEAEYAEYSEKNQILKTKGKTKIITAENYTLDGEDLFVDGLKKIIKSKKQAILKDQAGNLIYLENFEYSTVNNIFKSIGLIEIKDLNKNNYQFSQIYVDTKKREIIGTDSRAFLNQESFKINSENDPRIFSNMVNIKKEESSFSKNIFTLCKLRDNEKCPPWTIQSTKMLHDNVKKTVYYDNAIIKVYDIPIFYFPKLSHPDPTVDRRSGFLIPTLYDTKNLGSGISIPYFFDLGVDKNFTFTNRIYLTENPLFLGEYHQAYLNSHLITDFGYTEGYKKTSLKKRSGKKSHFFSKFVKNFKTSNSHQNSLELNIQKVSNDKYLKLYKIETNLVDYNKENIENSLNFTHERDDLFFGLNASVYETLKDNYNDKYEYILPEITLDKNLFSNENLGTLEFQANYKAHNFDTNKLNNFLINDFNYESNDKILSNLVNSKILANIRNINYESKNVDIFKDDPTSEIFGSVGLLSQINLKKIENNFNHFLKPKILLKIAPGSMRKDDSSDRLTPVNAFNINRVSNLNNYETGVSGTLGLDYKIKNKNFTKFDFSLAQVINEKENKKMSDKSSLNEKLSDLVGSSSYNISENIKLGYNFSLDQNYKDFNYNELGANYKYGPLNLQFDYLSENKHIGDQDYFETKLNLKNKDKGLLSFKNKRNLTTNSSEFYDLSYEYINDCLRAGLVYRREFYNDSEIEPEDSLMFKLTLVPFGNIDSPKLD